MQDALLHYYQRELAWLRQAGNDFAVAHPAIAASLQLGNDVVEDPQVAQLVEGVAFLNARIHQVLDDGLPQITDALLAQLFPSCTQLLPSLAIVEFQPTDIREKTALIDAGSTIITRATDGTPCRFRTVYPVSVVPIELASAQLLSLPLATDLPAPGPGACAVLSLTLRSRGPAADLSAQLPALLPLHLRAPTQFAWRLYDLLFNHCRAIGVTSGAENSVQWVDSSNLVPMGLDEDQAMLPTTPTALPAMRLLTEFLHFPAKFLFFALRNLAASCSPHSDTCTLLFYLDQHDHELAKNLSAEFFSLSATPAVNLFTYAAEPLRVAGDAIDLPLLADARSPDVFEIHSVTRVEFIAAQDGKRSDVAELHAMPRATTPCPLFWHQRRKMRPLPASHANSGYDSFISCGVQQQTTAPSEGVLHVTALCSNRNVPARLPAGAGQPDFELQQDPGRCGRIRTLVPPTQALRPPTGAAAGLRLLALLNLNQQFLFDAADPAALLRELLLAHDMADSATTRAQINSLSAVSLRPAITPLRRHGVTCFCRGLDIDITLQRPAGSHVSPLLYSAVLEQLLAQMISINNFVRVSLTVGDSLIRRSPPRSGTGLLL